MIWALPLHRSDFEHLIPHAGAMCLLSRVIAADAQSIRCEADTHTAAANPLRNAQGLPVTAGIEYAAQAMALHAALQRKGAGAVQGGAIAVLSDVTWRCDWLDRVDGPLLIQADLLAETGQGRQYNFRVTTADHAPLIDGVMIVAFGS